MGILTWLFGNRPDYLAPGSVEVGVLSPWQPAPTNLERIVASEIYGDIARPVTLSRAEALQIPAVAKGRHLIVSAIANLPLRAYKGDAQLEDQPTWLYRTDTSLTAAQPFFRLSASVDDLIFYGRSLWLTQRGATGFITEAAWTPIDTWRIDSDERVFLGKEETPLDPKDYILFHTPMFPGLLTAGAVTLRGARDTEAAWTARMESPTPIMELRVTSNDYVSQTEVEKYAQDWAAKHRAGEPSLYVSMPGMELVTHGGQGEADMYLESRNAVRLDVAAFLGIPAVLMDGSLSTASLTYTTTEGSRNRFYDETLPLWLSPIEAALSDDKCVPRSTRIRADKSELYNTPTPSGAVTED